MVWTSGALCCASDACVLMDISSASASEDWDKIPHVTQISVTQTANTPKLVTSSTGGRETSACGTVSQTGTLTLACHLGVGPSYLCINGTYRIRWAGDCAEIWDGTNAVAVPDPTQYIEAVIRITTVPLDLNIAGNAAVTVPYGFDVVDFIHYPTCQTEEVVATLF